MRDNKPHPINDDTWWYHDNAGMYVVHRVNDYNGEYFQTDTFLIPWRSLETVVRNRKKKEPKVSKTFSKCPNRNRGLNFCKMQNILTDSREKLQYCQLQSCPLAPMVSFNV